jgi:RND family efflux transporter MFP subunit
MARVEVDHTGADLDRVEKLFASGAIAQKSFDDARFACRAADAGEKQAASSLRQAELMVEHSVLAAPFPGQVIKKLANRGEMVDAGIPVLVLAQLDTVKVAVNVPATEMNRWAAGDEAWVDPGAVPAAAAPGGAEKVKALVHRVSPGADGMTGTFRVDLKLENKGLGMRPGQIVRVDRQLKAGAGLWIPLQSVVSRGQELKYVFVVDPSQSLVHQRQVKLGAVVGDRVEALEGLEAGSRVVVLMPEDLRDGDRVEVQ